MVIKGLHYKGTALYFQRDYSDHEIILLFLKVMQNIVMSEESDCAQMASIVLTAWTYIQSKSSSFVSSIDNGQLVLEAAN